MVIFCIVHYCISLQICWGEEREEEVKNASGSLSEKFTGFHHEV